jgi:hypothetical protein
VGSTQSTTQEPKMFFFFFFVTEIQFHFSTSSKRLTETECFADIRLDRHKIGISETDSKTKTNSG